MIKYIYSNGLILIKKRKKYVNYKSYIHYKARKSKNNRLMNKKSIKKSQFERLSKINKSKLIDKKYL